MSFFFAACVAALTFLNQGKAPGAFVADNEVKVSYVSASAMHNIMAICEKVAFNIYTGVAKVLTLENGHPFHKLCKYRLLNTENLQIEQSVESYICYIDSLTFYYQNLSELQRLNI